MHIRDYIEHLKRKPVHIRERIALGSAVGVTALVAVGWVGALVSSDVLAIEPADSGSEDFAAASAQTGQSVSELLGAASAFNASSLEAGGQVMIVDGEESSTIEPSSAEDTRTVIPF